MTTGERAQVGGIERVHLPPPRAPLVPCRSSSASMIQPPDDGYGVRGRGVMPAAGVGGRCGRGTLRGTKQERIVAGPRRKEGILFVYLIWLTGRTILTERELVRYGKHL